MYLHKENRELFRDAILLASQKLEVSEDIIEKDYYVTLILKKLSSIEYPVVFKGGTSLSKAFQIIDDFRRTSILHSQSIWVRQEGRN